MSLVTVQSEKPRQRGPKAGSKYKPTEQKKTLQVRFWVNNVDYQEYQKMAVYLHELAVIRNPTVPCFAQTALRKWYNEINEKLGEGSKNA